MFGNAPRPKRHPGKMPGGIKLIDCIHELQSIYRMMPVTERDRDDRAYNGFVSLASPSMIGDRMVWAEQAYLANAATETIRGALANGQIPVWCDFDGEWIELDSDIMFAPNKWERRAVLGAGVYRPLNLHRDHGDDQRASCEDATLWVQDADWPAIRDSLIAQRERRSGSVLAGDWRTLLQTAQDHVAGVRLPESAAVDDPSLVAEPTDRNGAPGRPTSKHIVLAEFDRRRDAGLLEPKVSGEALVLEAWFNGESQYSHMARMTAGTIENAIRDRFRRAQDPRK